VEDGVAIRSKDRHDPVYGGPILVGNDDVEDTMFAGIHCEPWTRKTSGNGKNRQEPPSEA
jgi:hypothetical protein